LTFTKSLLLNVILFPLPQKYVLTFFVYLFKRFAICQPLLTKYNDDSEAPSRARAGPMETFSRGPSQQKIFDFCLKWRILVHFIMFNDGGAPKHRGLGITHLPCLLPPLDGPVIASIYDKLITSYICADCPTRSSIPNQIWAPSMAKTTSWSGRYRYVVIRCPRQLLTAHQTSPSFRTMPPAPCASYKRTRTEFWRWSQTSYPAEPPTRTRYHSHCVFHSVH